MTCRARRKGCQALLISFPEFQCAAMKLKAILQLTLAAAESHPWVSAFTVVTKPFFHANAQHVLLISHTSPQSLYQHWSEQGEQELIMASLLLYKKAGFIDINVCSGNLRFPCRSPDPSEQYQIYYSTWR